MSKLKSCIFAITVLSILATAVIVDAGMTTAQRAWFYGLVKWDADLVDWGNHPVMEPLAEGWGIRPLEIISDSYGKTALFTIGSASFDTKAEGSWAGGTDISDSSNRTILLDVAGFDKCSINFFSVSGVHAGGVGGPSEAVVQSHVLNTGKSAFEWQILGTAYPATRLIGEASAQSILQPLLPGRMIISTTRATNASSGTAALLVNGVTPMLYQPEEKIMAHGTYTFDLSGLSAISIECGSRSLDDFEHLPANILYATPNFHIRIGR